MNPPILPQGLHFIERGWLSSNSLLIQNSDHAAIFDTGYVTHSSQLLEVIHANLRSQPLDLIVNSHLHSDHCGGNALLQATYQDVDIQIPEFQFDDVLNWDQSRLTHDISGQNCSPFIPTLHLSDGDVLNTASYKWVAYSAPGHDNDEFLFFEPENKILFSADALWENGLAVVFPEFLGGIGFEHVAKSLDLISTFNPRWVLPGHGSLFTDYQKAIDHARSKLDFFVAMPERHAFYAAKVLLKFRLLEVQSTAIEEFLKWCKSNQMLSIIHKTFYDDLLLEQFIFKLITDLVDRRQARAQSEQIWNM